MFFVYQYLCFLLVLDDLWNFSDVKFFDIRCRIMVIIRDVVITNMVGGVKVKVRISEGFIENELL